MSSLPWLPLWTLRMQDPPNSQRQEMIQPVPTLRIMGFLHDSLECYKALREQVVLAEAELNDRLAIFK
ncbi:uncharacterized protein TRAVEDRAFT_49622 [Trametes versicolor FP-101664 SS1]|uniref:uncharacterized protein n=1 Tax=Trametes versicolor (strain FP-101664) TaxID=717944 RepID=UPI00046245F7|nr:uncharacterized protein TRAVEDRAFT_49622 [Trametes versicolor FP-101664 SS1]EIW56800.1 hypothetical protein TRAVEDRAFT_49622 [Trametes versicolor FP-101664 SS1]